MIVKNVLASAGERSDHRKKDTQVHVVLALQHLYFLRMNLNYATTKNNQTHHQGTPRRCVVRE